MNEKLKQNSFKLIIAVILLVESLFLFALFFPTLEIFGYPHEEMYNYETNMSVTISPTNLFSTISSSYYHIGLKIAYVFMFSLQIFSIVLSCILLIIHYKLNSRSKLFGNFLLIDLILLVIENVLAISLFSTYVISLIICIIILALDLIFLVLWFYYYNKDRKENRNV